MREKWKWSISIGHRNIKMCTFINNKKFQVMAQFLSEW